MELKDLVGTHVLTAVDMNIDSLPQDIRRDVYENANVINFELDGVTYAVVEDPEDSYRSSMREILVVQYTIGNRFPPCKVKCKMRGGYSGEYILDMRDVITDEIVLSVGTERIGHHYPCFIAEFTPENMIINIRKKLKSMYRELDRMRDKIIGEYAKTESAVSRANQLMRMLQITSSGWLIAELNKENQKLREEIVTINARYRTADENYDKIKNEQSAGVSITRLHMARRWALEHGYKDDTEDDEEEEDGED